MTYELWDLDTGNKLGDFQTESAAVAAVRRVSTVSGGMDDLALERRDRLGRSTVLTGQELREWAQTWSATEARRDGRLRLGYASKSANAKAGLWAKGRSRIVVTSSSSPHHVMRDSKGRFVAHSKPTPKK